MKNELKKELKEILITLLKISFELIKMIGIIYFLYLAISNF